MRHVRVLTQPVGRLHEKSVLIHDPSGEPLLPGLPVRRVFRDELTAVLVVGHLVPIAEKEDAGRKEVHGGGLEELVRAAATFLLTLLEGIQQGLGGLARSRKVVDILELDRVDALGVLHIDEIDDVE